MKTHFVMKKILTCFALFSLIILPCFGQLGLEPYKRYYTIVGKGNSGEQKCSGSIVETYGSNQLSGELYVSTIYIRLSEMLHDSFLCIDKKIVDERTIKYNGLSPETKNVGDIIKQQCNVNNKVYFFTFPSLYQGQGRTVYKTVIDEKMNDLNDRSRYGKMYDTFKKITNGK